MMKQAQYFLTLISLIWLAGCNNQRNNDILLAEVNGEKYYHSDIYFPQDMSPEDSVTFQKQMVDNWVRQQLMYMDAKDNLTSEQLNELERRAENARKMLIIAAMEENLVSDSSKISVTPAEAQKYYEENKNEFLLRENIVRVNYIRLKKSDNIQQFRDLLKSDKADDHARLETLARNSAINYFLEDQVWLYFQDILKEIPIKAPDQEAFLNSASYHEITNDSVVYLVRFKDFKLVNSTAPFALVKDRIISLLIARKKNEILDAYRNNIYENALKEKKVTLYTD